MRLSLFVKKIKNDIAIIFLSLFYIFISTNRIGSVLNSIDTNLTSLQEIALAKREAENNRILEKKNLQHVQNNVEPDSSAIKTEISGESSSIKQESSLEDIQSKNLSLASNIYTSLGDIRSEISALMDEINKPNEELSIEYLEEADKMSNELITKVLSMLEKNNASSLVGVNYLNIYTKGLHSLKNIQLQDNEYLSKLNNLIENVKKEEDNYYKLSNNLYNNLVDISNQYDSLVNDKNAEVSSKSIQKNIISNAEETLKSVCGKLTPDAVIRLLQN